MEVGSAYITLGGYACCSPKTEYESQQTYSIDTSWWDKLANTYENSIGSCPGKAYVLMLKKDLDQLKKDSFHELVMGLVGSETEEIIIKGLVIVKASNTTPSLENDPNSCYFVELVDKRHTFKNTLVNSIEANVVAPVKWHKDHYYYNSSLFENKPYTWDKLIEKLWNLIGVHRIGPYPHLPYSPAGDPENFQFYGEDGWEVLNVLLTKLFCAIQYDHTTSFCNIIKLDVNHDIKDDYKDRLVLNREILESNLAKASGKISVYFNVKNKYYGTENTTDSSDYKTWINDSTYSIQLETEIEGAQLDSVAIFWDDIYAIKDFYGVIENKGLLADRARDILNSYKNYIAIKRRRKLYHGLLNIIPDANNKTIKFYCVKEGIFTEKLTVPGFINCLVCEGGNDLDILETFKPPDYNRSTYPVYFPQIQLLRIISGPIVSKIYDAKVNILNPETLTLVETAKAWVFKIPDDNIPLPIGMYFFGKVNGFYNIKDDIRPLYLITYYTKEEIASLIQQLFQFLITNIVDNSVKIQQLIQQFLQIITNTNDLTLIQQLIQQLIQSIQAYLYSNISNTSLIQQFMQMFMLLMQQILQIVNYNETFIEELKKFITQIIQTIINSNNQQLIQTLLIIMVQNNITIIDPSIIINNPSILINIIIQINNPFLLIQIIQQLIQQILIIGGIDLGFLQILIGLFMQMIMQLLLLLLIFSFAQLIQMLLLMMQLIFQILTLFAGGFLLQFLQMMLQMFMLFILLSSNSLLFQQMMQILIGILIVNFWPGGFVVPITYVRKVLPTFTKVMANIHGDRICVINALDVTYETRLVMTNDPDNVIINTIKYPIGACEDLLAKGEINSD